MGNMSYCRFTNTLSDLRDCNENIDRECSETEHKKRISLIKLCVEIADSYGDYPESLPYEKEEDEDEEETPSN